MEQNTSHQEWDLEIKPHDTVFNLHLKDVWNYRDLLWLLVRRDFVSFYKQTILGPLWFFIQPIFTTVVFTFVFGKLAHIETGAAPQALFYMAGTIAWNYFSDCLTKTSTVFRDNASIFGKVYFPRLIMPLSIVVSNLVKFSVQFGLFVIVFGVYLVKYKFLGSKEPVLPNWYILLFPVIMLLMALLGLGLGLIVTALTTKYRDLAFVVTFGMQLAMYATPIIYPLSTALDKYHGIIRYNPMSGLIETFRYGFTGSGHFYADAFAYSVVSSLVICLLGLIVFNKVEKDFVDTV
ncbi:ABC transporter permease [Mucilaginibacter psychrotolerans]|uniref:Transport permease protein n=1 Tax=Mucilaginibacter psychrotolerans TaxID=1524096 RepID=A0A4Y8SJH9_9SPHI|nr:ABC transporter permease [Mucilaginibacter psychrotolerans]TFF38825.1 ABC transporter permease [Mucilaginibacter psychrotolerans]